jgi:hypothetical protein
MNTFQSFKKFKPFKTFPSSILPRVAGGGKKVGA